MSTKKVLVINQPVANRGDESAHRGFIRALLQECQDVVITCLFVGESCQDNIDQFKVSDSRVHYVNLQTGTRSRQLSKLGLCSCLRFLWSVSPTIQKILSFYRDSDIVVCAPGGADLGGFLSWKHLTYLHFAKYCHKPLAYFGRSFGPLKDGGLLRRYFRYKSLEIMSYMQFVSLRDAASMQFADLYGIRYIPTVDSAFLEQPQVSVPHEVSSIIAGKNYLVFVPNVLIWHYNFSGRISREVIVDFYKRVGKLLLSRYADYEILMLPQTFNGTKEQNDINFFKELCGAMALSGTSGVERIHVLSDQYSSDIQQQIIRGASMLVGARYHSVIFSINNAIPFVGLSYEHKISGLLTSLHKEDRMVDLIHGLDTPEMVDKTLRDIHKLLDNALPDASTRQNANEIAHKALTAFVQTML